MELSKVAFNRGILPDSFVGRWFIFYESKVSRDNFKFSSRDQEGQVKVPADIIYLFKLNSIVPFAHKVHKLIMPFSFIETLIEKPRVPVPLSSR